MEIPQKNILYGKNDNEAIVVGFEAPESPDSSYNNVYQYPENDGQIKPPIVPQHLDSTVLNSPAATDQAARDLPESLPLPHNETLNHFYCENKETEEPVVAVGLTHRFREKYVTVVLYKPVQGNENSPGK